MIKPIDFRVPKIFDNLAVSFVVETDEMLVVVGELEPVEIDDERMFGRVVEKLGG